MYCICEDGGEGIQSIVGMKLGKWTGRRAALVWFGSCLTSWFVSVVFEQGRFCETFHSDDAGWRTCNSCKKVRSPDLYRVFFARPPKFWIVLLLLLGSLLLLCVHLLVHHQGLFTSVNPLLLQRVHCGCIASIYSFVLLDAGGVECHACAKQVPPALVRVHHHVNGTIDVSCSG